MKKILVIILVLVILGAGAVALVLSKDKPANDNLLGGDSNEHGCIGSAGYSWCEAKQKCLRVWEEPCESVER